MTAEQRDAKIAELERRMTRLETNMFAFQATVATKLTAAVKLMRRRQAERQARVGQALSKLAADLAVVRDRLGAVTGTSRLTH